MSGLARAFVQAWRDAGAPPCGPGHCAVALLAVGDWLPWLDDAHRLLDATEATRVLRQRLDRERRLRAVAYAAHRLLLAQVLDVAPREVPIVRDALGCPRLPGHGLHTSLAHADGRVALAVTADGPVGIDVEPLSRAAVMPPLRAMVCHPDEMSDLPPAGPDRALGEALLGIWVRKEALLKAAGVGLRREMTGFAAPAGRPLPLSGQHGPMAVLHMLDAGPALRMAVAAPPGSAPRLAILRPG